MIAPLQFSLPIPGTCWPSDFSALFAYLEALGVANVPDNITGITYGSVDPQPEGIGRPWFNTTVNRLYNWNTTYGGWTSLYWPPPKPATGSLIGPVLMWNGTEAQLAAYDDLGPHTTVIDGAEQFSGPFWEIAGEMAGRMPLGVGTLPLSGLTKAVTDTGGVDQVAITAAALPSHRHFVSLAPDTDTTSYLPEETAENGGFQATGASGMRFSNVSSTKVGQTRETGNAPDDLQKLDNMPPYYTVYFIRRTLRKFYTL